MAAAVPDATTSTGICIPLSGGNLRNGHFSLRPASHILPADSIGRSSKAEAGTPIRVTFRPGVTVETDIAGDKMILRERGAVRDFYLQAGAREGDEIILRRDAERNFTASLAPST